MKRTKSNPKSRKNLLSNKLVIGFIILGAISYFIYLRLPKATPTGIFEVSPNSTGVTLSFENNVSGSVGSQHSVDLLISAPSLEVTAAQVELSYDPSSISTPTLTQGDFLTEKLGNPKIQNGKINFVYSIPLQSSPKSGSGILATLSFKVLKDNPSISFTENTMIAASGLNSNALSSATGLTIATNSTQSNTSTPPTLVPPTTSQPKANNPKSGSPTTQKEDQTTKDTRVFNEAGNFDYSKPVNKTVSDDFASAEDDLSSSQLSGFAGFIQRVKAFLGIKNVQN